MSIPTAALAIRLFVHCTALHCTIWAARELESDLRLILINVPVLRHLEFPRIDTFRVLVTGMASRRTGTVAVACHMKIYASTVWPPK
jgi:hypothetical protein